MYTKSQEHKMSFFRIFSFLFALVIATAITPSNSYAKSDSTYDMRNINSSVEVSDPIEPVNRVIYSFNRFLDKILLKPVAKTYKVIVPEFARKGISNVLQNLTEPVTFFNAVLQGDPDRAFTSFWRFAINSTWGIGGLGDVADTAGLKFRKEDYGQTMGVYGSGGGPYLMLPILGPSNARDAFGSVVDIVVDPFTYILDDDVSLARGFLTGLDKRADSLSVIDEIDRVSLDPYASIRSLYTQKRNSDIRNGTIKR
ncbi:MAG: putative Surface lipoprotein [Rickettsiaceae bacterium]|jgi:phospholipid-binding lipoprotein MlaA|nr:putative Surface lipoprotein [Rickettsiaceae bacterium]